MSAPGEIGPISRESTAAIIADRLRSAIMHGSLAPGDQLGETDLAGRLGVSRGPLREATQRLVQEGLLRSERHRGLFVVELTADDVRDVYTARLAVERAACELVVRGDRGGAVAHLTRALDRLREAAGTGDRTAMSDADQAFHQTLVRASGSPRLERMAQTLLVETRMCLTVMQQVYPEPSELVEEHQKLLDAIADGDEELLLRLIGSHMMDTVERVNASEPPA
ncbi:GntR family transcriptional regulator [Actinorugispora endophytica]|uniref:DNA-binding GntR family transcriptional regulator n=1 Tax=Actinorugispora endophytica TaxID=1605990 RepID=A0A4R6UFC5_9ACTN|nr:GntR family transcriptional regulator [Actinorugispora endophytica]TDQ45520.1 DNA-binding GntR family transcriptional regulator [Actinorugispora endophytica]